MISSEGCAASRGWRAWARAAGAARRRCCWSARAAPRSRRARPACRRRPPRCRARRGSPPPGPQDTTVWSIETHGRTRTGRGPSRRPRRAARRCRTTRCASCRRCRRRRRCRPPSRASRWCARATPACPRPPSSPSTPPPGGAPPTPLRTTRGGTTIAYSFSGDRVFSSVCSSGRYLIDVFWMMIGKNTFVLDHEWYE